MPHKILVRAPNLQVDHSSPFSIDRLDRREFSDALLDLVVTTPTPCVLNLDAPWGQGKTTFLQMWSAQASLQHVTSLYFNAWESDFTEDPLAALIGELSAKIESLEKGDSKVASKQLEELKKIGGRLLRRSVPGVVRLATMGVINLPDLTEETLANLTGQIAEQEIRDYEESKRSISAFRSQLELVASTLAGSEENSLPLVILIDELDRCRPTYAVKLLETVKHLFSVPGVFFVVATDSVQLSGSIRHTYGDGVDSDGYLRRFFDLTLFLPKADSRRFVAAQFARFGLDEFFSSRTHAELRYDKDQVEGVFAGLFDATGSSLRDQERCFALLALASRATPEDHYLHPLLLCALIVLRIKNQKLYSEFCARQASVKDVVEYFQNTQLGKRFMWDHHYGPVVEAFLVASVAPRHGDDEHLQPYKAAYNDSSLSDIERERAGTIFDLLSKYSMRRSPHR